VKKTRLTPRQATQIGYSRAEKFLNISIKMLIALPIFGIFSLVILDIILPVLNPEGYQGSPPLNVRLELFILFVYITVFILLVLASFISSLIVALHQTPRNAHRLQPIMVNTTIISLPLFITIFSIFVDYSSIRGWVMLAMGLIVLASFTVTYSIYRHRLSDDYKSLSSPR